MKKNIYQLELDFTEARTNLAQAVTHFDAAAAAWACGLADEAPTASDAIHAEIAMMRVTVKRLVGILVDQSGLPFHAAWVMAYHELYKATGYHPVAHGKQTAQKVLLDQVQADGKLEELQETVTKMLIDPKYERSSESPRGH